MSRASRPGSEFAMVLGTDGSVWEWGDNTPVPVAGLTNVSQVAGGGNASLAVHTVFHFIGF